LDNASWTKTDSTVTANQIIAPDGTLTADKIFVNNAVTEGRAVQSVTVSAGAHTLSVIAKAAEWSWIQVGWGGGGSSFNLANGTVGTAGSGNTASIVSLGNGWYRCIVTRTLSAGSDTFRIYPTNADNAFTTGDGYSGIYIWGAQLEAGAFATPYILTVAAQVTRLADSAVMTGVNFSSWYRQDEGTFVAEVQTGPTSALNGVQPYYVLAVRDTNSDAMSVGFDSVSGFWNQVWVGNVAQASISAASVASSANKIAFKYKVNDFAVSSNGGAVGTDTVGTVPVVNAMQLGQNRVTATGSIYLKRITYYNQALTSANLQAVTR
jgi:hypothetical protein